MMALLKIYRFRKIRIGWLIVTLPALIIFLCGTYLMYPSLRARYLFHEVETLQLGHSTFEDAERLARKIHAKPNALCNRSACTWGVELNNTHLPRWWRGNGEVFAIAFSVKNSVVTSKYTGFGIGTDASFTPSHVSLEEQEHWERGNTKEPVQAGWYTTERFRYYWFTVRMTPKASPEDRRRYTSFNFNCFWKYRGCKDSRKLLPIAGRTPLTNDN
jgi:hypothetical protein